MRLTTSEPLSSPAYRTLGIGLGLLDEGTGTRPVAEVIPGTPAASGPIAAGDGVVSIDGVRADRLDRYELRRLVAEHDVLELTYIRDGREHTQELRVGVIPAE
ncbi:MAG: hypothetical protein ACR2GQ_09035 [Gemmatimonadota bacterium]